MNTHLKNLLTLSKTHNLVSGIKCNRCQRIQPTMPEEVFLDKNYKCECEKIINDPDFLSLTPTQDEIKEIDQLLIKTLLKRGAKPKNRPYEEVKAEEKEYNKNYYEKKKQDLKSVECSVCHGTYNYYSKFKHFNSKRHKKFLNQEFKNVDV